MPHPKRFVTLIVTLLLLVCISAVFWFRGKSAAQWEQQGRAAIDRRDYASAVHALEQAVAAEPQRATSWKLLADAAARSDQSGRACEALEELARLAPDEAGKLAMQLSSRWMTNNDIQPAIRGLRIVTAVNPESPDAYRLLAQIHGVIGNRRDVVNCLIELVKRNAFTRTDLIVLSSVNPTINDPNRLHAIQQTNPTDKSPLLPLAMQALDQNHIDEAKKLILEIIAADPEHREAQSILAELYADFLPNEFLSWHAQLSSAAEQDSRIWLARAKWLNSHQQVMTAIRCLLEAVAHEPENLSSTTLLGQLLKAHGDSRLSKIYTDRSRRLQRIIDLSERMKEPRANEAIVPMIDELEAVGRLWEAWAWCVIGQQVGVRPPSDIVSRRKRIEPRLQANLPRTDPGCLPNMDADRQRYPLPDWSRWKSGAPASPPVAGRTESTIRFEDQAEHVGLDFHYANSIVLDKGRKIFETMGAGVAVLDFDRDDWPDLYFAQGKPLPLDSREGPSDALYRNQSGERYLPVTVSAGIRETSYSQGVAAGDYDNDGFPDIYVANLGRNRLFHNNGDGTLTDVTEAAGIQQDLWTVSCAIADLNGDGLPELFDVNYVQGKDLLTATCFDEHRRPVVCRPTVFNPAMDTVLINQGDGRFQESQQDAGFDLPDGRGLGIVIADFNDDNRPDAFIANDMSANFLLLNDTGEKNQPLRFHDEAYARGVAVDANGLAQACMGIACTDVNQDGVPDLFITNFARESDTLYLSQPGGLYQDLTQLAGLREPTFVPLGFGTQFLDADRDGWADLVVANGHIDEFVNEPFRMKAQVFQGQPNGRFEELSGQQAGSLFDDLRLARGLARFDWNRDGRTDFVMTDLERPVVLAENQTPGEHHALRLKLVGTDSSRDAIGAKIRVLVADGDERVAQLTAGDGYESCNERVIEFGLGSATSVQSVHIRWPSGAESRFENPSATETWLAIENRPKQQSLGTPKSP